MHKLMDENVNVNFGYNYQLPTSSALLSLKNYMCQFTDLFSEFNTNIAPAHHHDRCERTVHMRLYTMKKREFVGVLLGFLTCFGLCTIVGLTGPPITRTVEITAKNVLINTTLADSKAVLATGPFVIKSPVLSTYSQKLWLIAKLITNNNDDEKYYKRFHISVAIDGITEHHKPINILTASEQQNRIRHLSCSRNDCKEFTVMHMSFLKYAHYIITIHFNDLITFHQKYDIESITFYFKTYSPEFTQIETSFRFIFLLLTFIVFSWYAHTLRKYSISDWSLEQKWLAIMLPLLFFYNNPLFPLVLLTNLWLSYMIDAIFQSTFLCALLMCWLCIYHGFRQTERGFLKFYLPKIMIILPLWLCVIVLATWEVYNESKDPTYSHVEDATNYYYLKIFFYTSGAVYIFVLCVLILKAYIELCSMPYFNMRLKFFTLLMLFVIMVSISVTFCQFGFGLLEDNFVESLNITYSSSVQFMCFYGLLNFYLYTMAFVYSPHKKCIHVEMPITKDNPSFSMINNSDEEVFYGSEDESYHPLTLISKNDYDSD